MLNRNMILGFLTFLGIFNDCLADLGIFNNRLTDLEIFDDRPADNELEMELLEMEQLEMEQLEMEQLEKRLETRLELLMLLSEESNPSIKEVAQVAIATDKDIEAALTYLKKQGSQSFEELNRSLEPLRKVLRPFVFIGDCYITSSAQDGLNNLIEYFKNNSR